MAVIRQLVEGSARDFEEFTDLARRVCALVEEELPGTLHYECFADPATGRFLWDESYRDAQAYLEHLEKLTEAGVMEKVAELVDFDRVTVLTPVEDPQVRAVMEQFGAVELSPLARVERLEPH